MILHLLLNLDLLFLLTTNDYASLKVLTQTLVNVLNFSFLADAQLFLHVCSNSVDMSKPTVHLHILPDHVLAHIFSQITPNPSTVYVRPFKWNKLDYRIVSVKFSSSQASVHSSLSSKWWALFAYFQETVFHNLYTYTELCKLPASTVCILVFWVELCLLLRQLQKGHYRMLENKHLNR